MASNNVVIVVLFIAMVTMYAASNVVVVVGQDEQSPYYKECYENGMKLGGGEEDVQRACKSIIFDLEH